MEVCDKVRVVRQACCYGLARNTECQIIRVEEETLVATGKTRKMYLCYTTEAIGQQVALWHCDSCLELIEAANVKVEE